MFRIVSGARLKDSARLLIDGMDQQIAQGGRTPAHKPQSGGKAFDRAAENALNQLFKRTGAICKEYRLGIIGRARLAKALQNQLRDRGYAANLIAKITIAVVTNALVGQANDHLS